MDVLCSAGSAGLSGAGPGGFGIKTVFRTSRRPRRVPTLRLIPVCWARYIMVNWAFVVCPRHTYLAQGISHIIHRLLCLTFILENGLVSDCQVHCRLIQTRSLSLDPCYFVDCLRPLRVTFGINAWLLCHQLVSISSVYVHCHILHLCWDSQNLYHRAIPGLASHSRWFQLAEAPSQNLCGPETQLLLGQAR